MKKIIGWILLAPFISMCASLIIFPVVLFTIRFPYFVVIPVIFVSTIVGASLIED